MSNFTQIFAEYVATILHILLKTDKKRRDQIREMARRKVQRFSDKKFDEHFYSILSEFIGNNDQRQEEWIGNNDRENSYLNYYFQYKNVLVIFFIFPCIIFFHFTMHIILFFFHYFIVLSIKFKNSSPWISSIII